MIFPKNRGCLPCGVQTIVPRTVCDFHPPADGMIGVFPLGAHVFTTNGLSVIPVSSKKPNKAPVWSPFFGAQGSVPFSIVQFFLHFVPLLVFLASDASIPELLKSSRHVLDDR